MSPERRALTVSAAAALGVGMIAATVGAASGSGAILLDAAFNLCFFATALVTLRVATLLQRPDNDRYPFGYLHFEPLVNLVKGLLILGVGVIALIDSARAIARDGNPVAAGPALAYAAFACLLCGATLLYLIRKRRHAPSPLVQGDAENWAVNLAISAGMFMAFCLALLFQHQGMERAARLVDPILVGLVVLLTAPVPVRMAARALGALLQRAPDHEVTASIEASLSATFAGLPLRRLYVRVVRPGRTTYAIAHVLLDESAADLDVGRADALRRAAVAAVAPRHTPVILDIVFTTVEAFAQPTTGFAIDMPPPADTVS